ncbi:hypothetical protein C0992_009924 [Termitomyces sp. T32_za158]|nr:hypothetical protein C0992_009924 [Termitomyces sp. T32_za158]
MDTAVERLGRVPVGLRRYVATVLVSPDVETHAYTLTSGDIHMFGDTQVDTWAAHAYDWASGTPFSESAEWAEAIGNDTCVPETYAATDPAEYMSSLPLFNNKDTLFAGTCAIAPSDTFSRHAAAPVVTPTRVQPNYPAPPQNSSVVPVVNAAQGTPGSTSSRKDNAAASLYYHGSKLAALSMSGSVLGWLQFL